MIEKTHNTPCGVIHYWIYKNNNLNKSLVLLPGLGFDHRLYDEQVKYFKGKYNILVWDAPGHASSYPFQLNFGIMDDVQWLDEIITTEELINPIIIGQSMGGYIAQAYLQNYPEKIKGFISIDSGPLQKKYVNSFQLFLFRWIIGPVNRIIPWNTKINLSIKNMTNSTQGEQLLRDFIKVYDEDHKRYADLSAHGMNIVADAYEADLPYAIQCPALLICGEKDSSDFINQNNTWSKDTGIKLEMVENASHISNVDKPEIVNSLIDNFLNTIKIN